MEHLSRYLIGIDLGTTNSVLAYIDTQNFSSEGASAISVFEVPQLVAPGEISDLPALPSFLYFPDESESAAHSLKLPWEERPSAISGVFAREQGALVPGRQVSSAKSWLSNSAVDRRGRILPPEAEPPQARVSPIEASAKYLAHLRDAWNHSALADGQDSARFLEHQQIVLTVPASFDEEARELTVEAAHQAGLEKFTLLEEPLAAFYAWMVSHRQVLREQLRDGDLVLICDIGGGTTDFSLVRTHFATKEEVQFERTAIGEHLLLGGDNLDLALARRVEEKLGDTVGKLSLRQRRALQRACSSAKERLLSDPSLDHFPITVLGTGRFVVGQMLTAELRRDEVVELLTNGFLPLTRADELPVRGSRSVALRELGLPYASDPAVTRHLAAFLIQAAAAMEPCSPARDSRMAHPDAILFNGGFCAPSITRERIADAIAGWFRSAGENWRPKILHNEAMDTAVAKGAAHYGQVRRGDGIRVRAGNARTYYVGLRAEDRVQGVCVLPSGVQEGTTLPLLDQDFAALANRPVSFTLFSSRLRHDAHGEVVVLAPDEVHRHAPLVTLLRYGKKMREVELAVRLRASFTEVGTLELWCESVNSPHRWRLQFELRGEEAQAQHLEAEKRSCTPTLKPSSEVPEDALETAVQLIRAVFGKEEAALDVATEPEALVSRLESAVGARREAWPVDIIRRLCDVLIEFAEGRRKTPRHEIRWLNLLGFCLRPGFGWPRDDSRLNQLRKLSLSGPAFPRDVQNEAEWLILWRRVAGGVNASQQQELYRKYAAMLAVGKKKRPRLNSQIEHEGWRLLASLEHLHGSTRAALGDELLSRIIKDPTDTGWLWSLGRVGSRIPLYGPLACIVASEKAAEWLKAMLDLPAMTSEAAYAIAQLGRRTGDSLRDVSEVLREEAISRLTEAGLGDEYLPMLHKFIPPDRSDVARMLGESLPKGLRLVSSAECLLSITALTPDPHKVA